MSMYFRYFIIISLLKRAWPFIWTNLNPLHPSMLCVKSGLKLALWFWRRWIFNFVKLFCYFIIISPWKRVWPFTWKNLNPTTQGCFLPSLVEIGPLVLEKKMKMWKVYRQTDGQTDGPQTIRKTHFFLAQVS